MLAAAAGPAEIAVDDPGVPTTGRRLAYARHLTSGEHPLVARVLVNRVWMHHFGRGIVATPGDFGTLGERPTHPELLDWLADEFMRGGWTLKRLHRLIMTSTAYRQSSRADRELDAVDPDNRLLGRMSVRRLEAEAVRDAILAASGQAQPDDVRPAGAGRPRRGGPGASSAWTPATRPAARAASRARSARRVPPQPVHPGPPAACRWACSRRSTPRR